MKNKIKSASFGLILLLVICGCGTAPYPTNVLNDTSMEMAGALAGGASGSGSLALNPIEKKTFFASFMQNFSFFPDAFASNSCPIFSTSNCSAGSETLSYSSCTSPGGNSATWSGSQILTFGNNSQCLAGVPVCGSGNTVTRTFGSNTTETTSIGHTFTLDTTNLSGISTPQVSGGFTVTGTASGQTIAINGIHVVESPLTGSSQDDDDTYTTNTTLGGSPLIVSIPNCGSAARTVTSGTIFVEANSTVNGGGTVKETFNNVTWNGTSCFPQSGTITEVATGQAGTNSITYTGGGNASILYTDGKTYHVTLQHCL